jgi:hypothetical protein
MFSSCDATTEDDDIHPGKWNATNTFIKNTRDAKSQSGNCEKRFYDLGMKTPLMTIQR